jgi:tRNA A37 threonylcarbamoyladenosine dehydratase
MSASVVLSTFNDHFMEFVNDVVNVFPENIDVLSAQNAFTMIRKANPKLLIKIWSTHIVSRYKDVIEAGDLGFFVEKDYLEDFSKNKNAKVIIDAIDRIRNPVKLMSIEDQTKTMKYVQNLTKLAQLYEDF